MPGHLPADLAAVVGPLREAEEYTRLQDIRQRGLYNLVTGLPMPLLLVAQYLPKLLLDGWNPETGPPPWWFFVVFASAWIFFVLACFPRTFMPLVRRHRPDWQSPLIEASLLKKLLEKVFWIQLPCLLGYGLAAALAMLTALLTPFSMLQMLVVFAALAHAIAMATLAWHANRGGEVQLARTYRALILLSAILLAAAPVANGNAALIPVILALLVLAVVLPPVALGLYRLLAPRRWLVR